MARLLAVLVALCIGVGVFAFLKNDQAAERGTTSGPPAVGNFRILSAAQSATLVRFGKDVRSCAAGRGIDVGPLVVRRTRISMHLAEHPTQQVVEKLTKCAERLGGPPPRSSLQIRGDDLLLYLPVRCLLDPKVARSQTS